MAAICTMTVLRHRLVQGVSVVAEEKPLRNAEQEKVLIVLQVTTPMTVPLPLNKCVLCGDKTHRQKGCPKVDKERPTPKNTRVTGSAPFENSAPPEVGGGPQPQPPEVIWTRFFSGPSADQKFSLMPSAPVSSAPSVPLKTQHHFGGGGGLKRSPGHGATTEPPCLVSWVWTRWTYHKLMHKDYAGHFIIYCRKRMQRSWPMHVSGVSPWGIR